MAFIRIQNAKKDEYGNIIGGSASLVESAYQKDGKSSCKQVLKESLGTIVFMENRKSGIFLSKTRGLIHFDVNTGEFTHVDKDDPRVVASGKAFETRVRTMFGDCDLISMFMLESGMMRILRDVAVNDAALFSKMICHTLHGVLRDGARICCDRFIERSFISNIVDIPMSVLRTDTRYYKTLGQFEVRLHFFRKFVQEMRLKVPGFGKGCYVDSTPLPNSISDLPTNRNCSHGTGSVGIQTRLVLILDIRTGLPVWFDLIPSNLLDLNTIMGVTEKVSKLLDVHVDDMVLDAGYVSRNVIEAYNLDDNPGKTLIARMPAKNGFDVEGLFASTRDLFSNAKYGFVRQGHTYFGMRKEIKIFGKREYAYIYVDHENASEYYKNYLIKNSEEYRKMSVKGKNEIRYHGGFFVLVSNIDTEPEKMLDRYYGRTEIETVFNCGKEYIGMLPLSKHGEETVSGKIMQDMITLIVYIQIRKITTPTGRSVSDYIYDLQSLDCYRSDEDTLIISAPNRQAKEAYRLFGYDIPGKISIKEYRDKMFFSTF